jgi:fluoride exporter
MKFLLIALGGAIGSVARYGTGALLLRATEKTLFPWGTLAVNLIGCLLIGYINGLIDDRILRPEYRFLLVVGLLGGFTTFSAFGWESAAMVRHEQFVRMMLYVLASNLLGIALVLAGYGMSRLHR